MGDIYGEGNRGLQDQFDSRDLADRLGELIIHDELSDQDRIFIESRDMFFLSSVDEQGWPTVSYKGGDKGFVRAIDNKTIAFPGYDGNGMFLSAGNIVTDERIGMLFIDFENPHRLRLHGKAIVNVDDPLLDEYVEAQYIIRVTIENLFVNCARYIHKYEKIEDSGFVPKPGQVTPEADWKRLEIFQEVLPGKD